MKLRNKKTGQEGNFIINKDHFECVDLEYVPEYRNLAELNEDWEDYEEPIGCWYIDFDGEILSCVEPFDDETEENRKSIGNCFETNEEAEKAVEKLKAWKWLKDYCNFSFNGIVTNSRGKFVGIKVRFNNNSSTKNDVEQALTRLNLLFGGKE